MSTSQPRTIALYVGSLGLGGAQRVLLWLARELQERGHRIVFITDEVGEGERNIFRLDPGIKHEFIDLSEGRESAVGKLAINFARVRKLRAILRRNQADTILAMLPRACVLAVLATRGMNCRAVIAERNAPWHRREEQPWEALRRMTYRFAEKQVAQTRPIAEWLERETASRAVHIIPNAVQLPLERLGGGLNPATWLNPNARLLLAVGTKPWQKGFDLLVEAFARVASEHPEWDLAIVGLRSERQENGLSGEDIANLAAKAGLESRVHFPGHVGNMADWYDAADAFVLSSRFEGFPNVLIEALAAGKACVSFDCDTGPEEIIRDGIDGILVREMTATALASALSKVMGDPAVRAGLASEAPQVVDRYAPDAIMAKWCEVLDVTDERSAS
jgi:glycosyltransferase involved in cell wall biosynthesis|tara:strand:- start:15354 stop:16523 length:1170 start_codon:yes stop_codon:yes gene_type:complete